MPSQDFQAQILQWNFMCILVMLGRVQLSRQICKNHRTTWRDQRMFRAANMAERTSTQDYVPFKQSFKDTIPRGMGSVQGEHRGWLAL